MTKGNEKLRSITNCYTQQKGRKGEGRRKGREEEERGKRKSKEKKGGKLHTEEKEKERRRNTQNNKDVPQ